MNLQKVRELIIKQAIEKKWSNENWWLDKKLEEELKEFKISLTSKLKGSTAIELIDVMYILLQMYHNIDPNNTIDLDEVFVKKYEENYIKLKKTVDEKGRPVRR